MTPQEQQALQELLSQLVQVKNIPKDAQAEAMISEAVSRQPDAAYLLVQRCMLLEQGVEAAKAQIAELQRQAQHNGQSSFLDANAWGHHASASQGATPNRQMETSVAGTPLPANPAQPYANPPYAQPQARAGMSSWLGGGQGGSMLGTMAATAAGVAGGAFLFQGLSHLLGGQHHGLADTAAGLGGDQSSSMFSSSALSELGPDKFGLQNQQNQDAQTQDGSLADDLFASDDASGADSDLFGSDDSDGDLFAADDSGDSDTYDT